MEKVYLSVSGIRQTTLIRVPLDFNLSRARSFFWKMFVRQQEGQRLRGLEGSKVRINERKTWG